MLETCVDPCVDGSDRNNEDECVHDCEDCNDDVGVRWKERERERTF